MPDSAQPDVLGAFLERQAPAIGAAAKTTLGCVIATLIVMTIHVPHEAWALITVLVLSGPEVGASFQKGTLRLLGTIIGAGLAVEMIDLFSQDAAAFSIVLFGVSMYGSYKAAGTRFPFAYLIGLVTLLIVGVEALSDPSSAEWTALVRCAEVIFGVLATILVTVAISPLGASDKLHDALARTIDDCRTLLNPRAPADDTALTRLLDARQQHQGLLQLAGNERYVSGKRFERLSRAVVLADRVVDATLAADAIHRFAGLADPPLPGEPVGPVPHSLLRQLEELAGALRANALRSAQVPAEASASAPGTNGRTDGATLPAVSAGIATLGRHLAALRQRVPTLGPQPPAAAVVAADDVPLLPPSLRTGAVDRVRLLHAFKVAVSLQIGLWIWAIFHLPAAVQAMVTVLLVSQKTLGASQFRSALRLVGALAGGTIGILVAAFIIPLISSVVALICVIAPIIFLCVWVNDGSKRYGYAGFQAAFAFVLTIIGGPSPEPDPLAPVLRFTGILIGAAVALTVMHSIAPIDPWRSARAAIASLLEQSGWRLRALLDRIPVVDADWAAAMATLRDEAAANLGELRDGGRRSRALAAELDPIMHLVSRFAAVVAIINEGGDASGQKLPADPELKEIGRAIEHASARVAAALRARDRARLDESWPPARMVTAGAPHDEPALSARVQACVAMLHALAEQTAARTRATALAPACVPESM